MGPHGAVSFPFNDGRTLLTRGKASKGPRGALAHNHQVRQGPERTARAGVRRACTQRGRDTFSGCACARPIRSTSTDIRRRPVVCRARNWCSWSPCSVWLEPTDADCAAESSAKLFPAAARDTRSRNRQYSGFAWPHSRAQGKGTTRPRARCCSAGERAYA